MAITLRLNKGSALTYQEMDENLSQYFYSSSLHSSGSILRLHYTGSTALDVPYNASRYVEVPLNSGSIDISNNADNRVITATGTDTINGEATFTYDGNTLKISGSLVQGLGTDINLGFRSHTEGNATQAPGLLAHAEGETTTAIGNRSHAEGDGTISYGLGSHAEGYQTIASGSRSHTEGNATQTKGDFSHAEGQSTTASGSASHAEGNTTIALGISSHAEGLQTTASGSYSHAEGINTVAQGTYSHAEGEDSIAIGQSTHAEGKLTEARGLYTHVEGVQTKTAGTGSHAEGISTVASGSYSHAEGSGTLALETNSHAEGLNTTASGTSSHAEGSGTISSGSNSHAEGVNTISQGIGSHAEGSSTLASGNHAHAEGLQTTASGEYSHAEGYQTVANTQYQHVQGTFNTVRTGTGAFVVGAGTDDSNRKNLIFASGSLVEITGSLSTTDRVTIQPQHPLPGTSATGSIAVSGSSAYLSDGASWNRIVVETDISPLTALNYGSITGILWNSSGSLTVAGDISAATYQSTADQTIIDCTMVNNMPNTSYIVKHYVESMSGIILADNGMGQIVFRPESVSTFQLSFEELVDAVTQDLKIHLEVFPRPY